MRKIATIVLTLSLALCLLLTLSFGASADSTGTMDGLEVTISTDKTEYAVNEDIYVSVTVFNTNEEAVENLWVAGLLPEGLVLKSGSLEELGITVEAGEAYSLEFVAHLPVEEILPPAVTPATGDGFNGILLVLVLVASAIAMVLLITSKKGAKVLCLMLCLSMAIAAVPVMGAAADEQETQEPLSVENEVPAVIVDTTVTVDGDSYTILGGAMIQTFQDIIFDLNIGLDTPYATQTVGTYETVTRPANPTRDGYRFTGWYLDPACENAYNFDSFVMEAFTLYAGWEEYNPLDGTLIGKICQAADGNTAITNATVEIYQGSTLVATKYTDANGSYSVSLPAGNYTVVVSCEGYLDFTAYAFVQEAQTTYLETYLMIVEKPDVNGIAAGTVINSLTGAGEANVQLDILANWNNNSATSEAITTVTTAADGSYSVALPLGNYTVRASKENFTTGYFNIIVQEGTTANQNGTITPVVSEELGNNFLITLTWEETPSDLDSHMEGTLSNGNSFHVYYGDENQTDGQIVVCDLDYDDISSFGPEHITLMTNTDQPYYYYVHQFSTDGTLVSSGARITVEQGNQLIAEFNVPTVDSTGRYWNVFAIKDGQLIIGNTITSSPDTTYAD